MQSFWFKFFKNKREERANSYSFLFYLPQNSVEMLCYEFLKMGSYKGFMLYATQILLCKLEKKKIRFWMKAQGKKSQGWF